MFTEDQKAALNAPLHRASVKKRKQGGRDVSYIEGWHAIAEANRIFGFDGWGRETVEVKCVAEAERKIGREQKPGWGVSYTATVRVTVRAGEELMIKRTGVGAGHGIDVDLGQAHESAIKEAETDAMKRALMTFGNPFGLALYDKEQTNVADDAPLAADPRTGQVADELIAEMPGQPTSLDLDSWARDSDTQKAIEGLDEMNKKRVRAAYAARLKELQQKEAA